MVWFDRIQHTDFHKNFNGERSFSEKQRKPLAVYQICYLKNIYFYFVERDFRWFRQTIHIIDVVHVWLWRKLHLYDVANLLYPTHLTLNKLKEFFFFFFFFVFYQYLKFYYVLYTIQIYNTQFVQSVCVWVCNLLQMYLCKLKTISIEFSSSDIFIMVANTLQQYERCHLIPPYQIFIQS